MTGENLPEDNFPFFDLNALLAQAGSGDPWAMAAQIAASIASEGGQEANLDPSVRFEFEDLVRVAELNLGQVPGLQLPTSIKIVPTNRTDWVQKSLKSYRPFLERFGEAVAADTPGAEPTSGDPMSAMIGQAFSSLGPMLVTISTGTMLGHLAQQSLGQYDLPVPRDSNEILVIPTAIDAAAAKWDVQRDDLRLWILIQEMATHTVLSIPHVRKRLETLLLDFASAFRPNNEMIQDEFGSMSDLSQLEQIGEKFNNPEIVLSMMRSPGHDLIVPQLDALVAAILGYVSHVVKTACDPLLPSHPAIQDHFRQRWVDSAPADRFTERLLGLEIDENTLQRGDSFISGISERAGQVGLDRLWADDLDLPTAAEIDAPGLWLERIGLTSDAKTYTFDIPDDLSGLEIESETPDSDDDATPTDESE